MKYQAVAFATSTLLGLAAAGPYHRHHHAHVRRVTKREVPQEHSHEIFLNITREFLNKENPKNIGDPVFGLLGDGAAANGAGQVTNLACLHQETADQAFTNAKAEKNIRGMSGALVFQALERNTAGIGVDSAACTDKAVNPEIAAIKQHQDPAGDGAAANNKAVTLELAKQLAAIGGDPMLALESGTFAPGDKNDNTFKGNSCDEDNDPTGCIFTQKKLVLDATPEEITAAVAGITPTITDGVDELKATHIDFTGLTVAGGGNASSGGATGNTGNANTGNANTGNANTGNASNNSGNNNNANKNTGNASKNNNGASCKATNPNTAAANNSTANAGNANSGKATNNANSGKATNNAGAAKSNNGASCKATNPNAAAANSTGNANTGNANSGNANTGSAASGTNIQTFTGTLGGAPPPVIQSTGDRPFSVNGNTFTGAGAALGRSCDIQHNACANAANSGKLTGGVQQCEDQNSQCRALIQAKRRRSVHKKRQASDFGSCTDPSISFSSNLKDRQEAAFIPNNVNDFNHGSAQKIGIIAGFICQRLQDSCKAPQATVDACNAAQTAATAATQDQTAADVFNSKLIGGAATGGAAANNGAANNGAAANTGAATGNATAAEDCA